MYLLFAEGAFINGQGLLLLLLMGLVAVVALVVLLLAMVFGSVFALRSKSLPPKLVMAGVVLLLLSIPVVWYVANLPGRDYVRLTQAGFVIEGSPSSSMAAVEERSATREPRPWWTVICPSRSSTAVLPQEFAAILGRHRSVLHLDLRDDYCEPNVLRQAAQLPRLDTLRVHSSAVVLDDWIDALPAQTNFSFFDHCASGLKPGSALQVLHCSPDLVELGLPLSALNEDTCAAILKLPLLRHLWLYDMDANGELQTLHGRLVNIPKPQLQLVRRLEAKFDELSFRILKPGEPRPGQVD